MSKPKTLQQAVIHFSNPDNALAYMVALRWPNGVECPTCGRKDVVFLKNQRKWQCKSIHPKRQFTAKVGTIFEDSPVSLDKWLVAVWMVANCKNGISSYELGRAIGVTQKSAWFMLHRIRLAMQRKSLMKIGGPGSEVEVDETFIGGAARFMNPARRKRMITGRGVLGKTPVIGILDRERKEVRAAVIAGRRRHHVEPQVIANVKPGTMVYSDNLPSYDELRYRGFYHDVVDHAVRYVDGRVHTNGLENFWSLLKRGLKGTYVAVEPFHLFRYVDEQVFRYNNRATKDRKVTDSDRLELVLGHVLGKRLTFAEVTGKVGATPSLPN